MREYATQMEAARKGIITEELKKVAQKELMTVEELKLLVAAGKVVICANKNHKCIDPQGVGSMLKTKINVNLGVSKDCKDYDMEMGKVMEAVNMGAHAIMDLSSHGNTIPFRRKLTAECPAMIGTVPVYDSVIHYQRDLSTLKAKDFIDVVRFHAEDGVDFVTLHCGITKKTIEQIKKHKRKMNIVSRGGSLVFAWMCMTGEENPFYEYYDEILDICREYDVTISLGDACRPGCLADASDVCQIEELVRLGELTKRAWEKDVQVMVEGPGHMPIDQIAANMKIQQTICNGAPFYVLGPLVTDIAPGHDHITSAIGGAIAASAGAAFLCYVTPAEHLALPNLEDVKQGIIASKIAAHAADIAKGVRGAREIDDRMADARRVFDWEAQWECAIDPETAKKIRADRKPEHEDTCSMCGKFCAIRSMNKALAGEHIDIL
ncbi:phosphomethylpyrimidine synthase ThiC [Desulfosporosinus sp. SYSU MS00001]|uniref:phosphomethylpyrimidine synthase ThiC n=1 Tax=Desulfosporosinus sp. SYSU MS00001 TaxID=3416284 RepID=UPI003CE759F6